MATRSCRALSSLQKAVNEKPMQPIDPRRTRARKIPGSFRPAPPWSGRISRMISQGCVWRAMPPPTPRETPFPDWSPQARIPGVCWRRRHRAIPPQQENPQPFRNPAGAPGWAGGAPGVVSTDMDLTSAYRNCDGPKGRHVGYHNPQGQNQYPRRLSVVNHPLVHQTAQRRRWRRHADPEK